MRPSIEFAFLDADVVLCLKESSLSIQVLCTCGFFQFYSLSCVVSHCICVAWGVFPCPHNCALIFIKI